MTNVIFPPERLGVGSARYDSGDRGIFVLLDVVAPAVHQENVGETPDSAGAFSGSGVYARAMG
jgi:hypothetical protein